MNELETPQDDKAIQRRIARKIRIKARAQVVSREDDYLQQVLTSQPMRAWDPTAP